MELLRWEEHRLQQAADTGEEKPTEDGVQYLDPQDEPPAVPAPKKPIVPPGVDPRTFHAEDDRPEMRYLDPQDEPPWTAEDQARADAEAEKERHFREGSNGLMARELAESSAYRSWDYDPETARKANVVDEKIVGFLFPGSRTEMERYNRELGTRIGRLAEEREDIPGMVRDAWKRGELMTNPEKPAPDFPAYDASIEKVLPPRDQIGGWSWRRKYHLW